MKLRASNPARSKLSFFAALLATPAAYAASGTWLGTSGDWGNAGTWSGGTIADAFDSTANFTGVNITADQTINLDVARTIGNITFTDTTTASNNLTISGASILTLDRTTGAPIIDVTQTGRTLAISSQISGADGLQKNGTGILSLSGPNDYTGTTVISNGTLSISHSNALGSTSGNTTIAGTGLSAGAQLSISGNINSAENITLTGNTDQNQYNAVINNISGTNTLSGNVTLASPSGSIRIGSLGGELIFGGALSQTGTTRTLILLATSGSALTVNNAIANNNGPMTILGTYNGAASNGVTLKTASTAIGATSVMENGLLKLGITNALPTNQSLTLGVAQNFNGNGGFDFGKFDLAGFNQTVNALVGTKNSGFTIGADSNRIVTNSAASGTGTLTVGNGNGSGTFNGVILNGATAAVALTKVGTGTQTLVGDSNYSGVTTITAGTLAITHSNALGTNAGNTTIAANGNTNGGILQLSNNITSPENITITGASEQNSFMSAIFNTGGNNTLSGDITLASPTGGIRLGTNAGSLLFSGNISQTGTTRGLTFSANTGTTITVNNPIANNGGPLAVYGAGSVTLKGVNGVGGLAETAIAQGGTIKLGVTDALNTTANLTIGTFAGQEVGNLDLAGFNQTVNALNGVASLANSNRKITNSAAGTGTNTITVGNGNGTGTFNGLIQDGTTAKVAFTKTGSGNQTLNGNHTYTGGTLVSGGTLTLGDATNTLANGGSVNVNGGTLALGTNTDTVGAVTLTSGNITGTGAGMLTGTGSNFDVRSGTIDAKIGGTVGLTKSTDGTVTINSDNSSSGYTGATTISAGNLAVNGSLANTATTVAIGGTLSGSGSIGGSVTVQSGGTLAAGNSIQSLGVGALALQAGSIFSYEANKDAIPSEAGDLTFATGNLDITATAVLSLTELGSGSWSMGEKLTLASYTGTWNGGFFTLDGNTLADDTDFNFGGVSWTFNYNDTIEGTNYTADSNGTYVTMTVVPEPNVALLGGLGVLALLRRRRSS